jgi:Outer membrane protein and related peptidoglycan-associated (lipo)proteins
MITLAAVILCTATVSSFAQEQNREIKEEGKIVFNPHWFIQLQGGIAHTIGEANFKDLLSPTAALNIGYKFSPVFAMRLGGSGWQAKGGWSTANYKFNYLQGNLDFVFDLANLFGKFKYNRCFNPYIFVGAGYAFGSENGANDLNKTTYSLPYLWEKENFFAGRAGLGADFRLSDRVDFTIEGNVNGYNDHFNSKQGDKLDYQINGLLGFKIKLGKGYHKTEPIYYEVAKVEKQDEQPKVVEEPKKEEPKKEEPVIVKPEPISQEIFFLINSSVLRENQMDKVDNIVNYLNENKDSKVQLIGYADKNTGNAEINMELSENRANVVRDMLIKKGIDANRISVDFKGDKIQPNDTPEENRVCICIAE